MWVNKEDPEGVAELKFWNFNVPYKAYMALTNVKTLQLWKFCNTVAPYIHRVLSEDNTTVCITYPTNNRGVSH